MHEGWVWGCVLARDGGALHVAGNAQAGQAEHGGGQIHEADQPVADTSGLVSLRSQMGPALGEVHEHGHVQPRVVGPALGARHARAVVTEVEDDRVVGQAIGFELGQDASHLGVHLADLVVVLGPVLSHLGRVRVIGRKRHLLRVVNGFVRARADAALVADREVEHGEEGLPFRPLAPMSLTPGEVPDLAGLVEVVVLLGAIAAVVAGLAQPLGKEAHALGQVYLGAHVQGAQAGSVHPGDQGGACRSADRSVGPGAGEAQTARTQTVQVGRRGVLIPITTQMRPVVLTGDPKDVGPYLGLLSLNRPHEQGKHRRGASVEPQRRLVEHGCPEGLQVDAQADHDAVEIVSAFVGEAQAHPVGETVDTTSGNEGVIRAVNLKQLHP